jgi:hypothetical protein
VNCGELSEWDSADARNDVVADDAAMADRSLVRNPAININGQPMLKVFRHAHLSRVNVSPLIPAIEQTI